MKRLFIFSILLLSVLTIGAQQYRIPVEVTLPKPVNQIAPVLRINK